MAPDPKTFLLTGASGYIASWIAKYLLDEGHNVHATVRDNTDESRVGHLKKLAESAAGRLDLFDADLMQSGSFNRASQGCDLVIHTASPFFVQGIKNPRRQLIDPALEGTRNVLRAVNQTPSVKRVVLTSTVAAISADSIDVRNTPGGVFTEKVWNQTSSEKYHPYAYSKTVAEREAWKMVKEQDRWDLVVVNPGFVMGPSLSRRTDSTSIRMMLDLVSGKFKAGVPEMYFPTVDVREVARAHILAATKPDASGRHILVADTLPMLGLADLIRKKTSDRYRLPKKNLPTFMFYLVGPFIGFGWKMIRNNVGISPKIDNSYSIQDLGITYRPLEETLADHVEQVERDGLVG